MNVALTASRVGYLAVGAAGLIVGLDRWLDGDPAAGPIVVGGVLAVAAAAWVTSTGLVRGALASIGIVAGALLVAMPAFLAAAIVATFGDWVRAALSAGSIAVALAAGWVMWRASPRPWGRDRADAVEGDTRTA